MENVILIIHLLLALSLIGVVLMQRSEGGGLGIGGGGGAFTARSAATALGKVTWILAIAFICTSITLTILAARNAGGVSVTDRITLPGTEATEDGAPEDLNLDGLLPPPSADDAEAPADAPADAPLVPKAD